MLSAEDASRSFATQVPDNEKTKCACERLDSLRSKPGSSCRFGSGDGLTSVKVSKYIDSLQRTAITAEDEKRQDQEGRLQHRETGPQLTAGPADHSEALTCAFVRLTDLPNHPIDRLSRYEATLWRQASQILFALHFLERGTSSRLRVRLR